MIIRPTLPETPNYTTPRGTIKLCDIGVVNGNRDAVLWCSRATEFQPPASSRRK